MLLSLCHSHFLVLPSMLHDQLGLPFAGVICFILSRDSPVSVRILSNCFSLSLCFRAHSSLSLGSFPTCPPVWPQQGLQKDLRGVWMPLCIDDLWTDMTFCLFLQPLSANGVLSASSTASNRSRNRSRYRTKAMNSEVDESLFGGIKVTLRKPCQVPLTWRQNPDHCGLGQILS